MGIVNSCHLPNDQPGVENNKSVHTEVSDVQNSHWHQLPQLKEKEGKYPLPRQHVLTCPTTVPTLQQHMKGTGRVSE
jgi:hypothetical protein